MMMNLSQSMRYMRPSSTCTTTRFLRDGLGPLRPTTTTKTTKKTVSPTIRLLSFSSSHHHPSSRRFQDLIVVGSSASSSSFSVLSSLRERRQWKNHDPNRAMSTGTSNDNQDEEQQQQQPEKDEDPSLLYESPAGKLISRLKIISITSCFMSIVGLPCMIFLKNGDWPNAKQLGMGGIAFLGATGSTLALHFVFGPYILDLKKQDNDNDDDDNDTSQTIMFKATTRSVFGWRNEYVFDPQNVSAYVGMRPFANFVVNDGTTPLYAHPELLNDTTRRLLLGHLVVDDSLAEDDDDDDENEQEEGVSSSGSTDDAILEKKKKQKAKKQQAADDDDGFVL